MAMDGSKILSNTSVSEARYDEIGDDEIEEIGRALAGTLKHTHGGGFDFVVYPTTMSDDESDALTMAAEYARKGREYYAKGFLRDCTFDSVLKTCIESSGRIWSWLGNSYGMKWVAVHGIDNSICVVNRFRDLEMTRVDPHRQTWPEHKVMYSLTEAIMSEIEGLPYDDDTRERSSKSINKPFGVVSVIPVTKKSHDETGKDKAIKFLKEKMKNETAITFDETIKTAISAFQHLCLQELKAEKIWVTAWDGIGVRQHMPTSEIEVHLGVINGCSRSRKQKVHSCLCLRLGDTAVVCD